MIKFEEHDDNLFRMLEEPVPLTDDAELPVLVRLIQDDTMLGKANKRSYHPDTLAEKIICSSSKLTDDGLFMDGNYTYCYEIIGTLVEEGSEDWALYQMMSGEIVYHKKSPSIMYCENAGYIKRKVRYGCVDHMSVSVWLNRVDKNGWQIYEKPNPESENIIHGHIPADMHLKYFHLCKVGDWVRYDNGTKIGQAKILRIYDDLYVVIDYLYSQYEFVLNGENITRKLSPSEVVIPVNISGTVRQAYNEDGTINDEQFQLLPNGSWDGTEMFISFDALDTQTRELVESLIKAQEEEK